MIYSLIITITAILLVLYRISRYRQEFYIDAIFFVFWIAFSIEYYTTVDYVVYSNGFESLEDQANWEPLYKLLVTIFQPFGFQTLVSVTAAFELATLCFMMKKLCPRNFLWFSIILMLLNFDFMVMMNVKRQFLAMCVVLWSVWFFNFSTRKHHRLIALGLFVVALLTHTSSFIAVFLYPLCLIKHRIGKWGSVVMIVLYFITMTLSLMGFMRIVSVALSLLSRSSYTDYYGAYVDYQLEGDQFEFVKTTAALILSLFGFCILLYCCNKVTRKQYPLLLAPIVASLCGNFLTGDLWRLMLYYSMFSYFAYPIVLSYLWKRKAEIVVYAYIGLSLLYWGRICVRTLNGKDLNNVNYKYRNFYTIFDDRPDISTYYRTDFDSTAEDR